MPDSELQEGWWKWEGREQQEEDQPPRGDEGGHPRRPRQGDQQPRQKIIFVNFRYFYESSIVYGKRAISLPFSAKLYILTTKIFYES